MEHVAMGAVRRAATNIASPKYVEDLHSLASISFRATSHHVDEARDREQADLSQLIAELQRTVQEHKSRIGRTHGRAADQYDHRRADAAGGAIAGVVGSYSKLRKAKV